MKIYIVTARGKDGKPFALAIEDHAEPALKAYDEARTNGKHAQVAFFSRPLANKRWKGQALQTLVSPAAAKPLGKSK